ncbi:MAG: transcriptional regulator [Nitrososphaerales archaeon]
MLLPSEIESKSLIPAVRVIIARKLASEFYLKEEDIAKMLGVTQAAISNYVRGTRGDGELITKLNQVPEVMRMVDDIVKDLASNKAYTPSSMAKFIELCNYMRQSLLICDVHHSLEKNIDESVCKTCESNLLKGN